MDVYGISWGYNFYSRKQMVTLGESTDHGTPLAKSPLRWLDIILRKVSFFYFPVLE